MTELSHVSPTGQAHMVDVTDKEVTARLARAHGAIRMKPETLAAIQRNEVSKGDVLSTARLAGIMAAKRTWELIPLCHPLSLTDIQIDITAAEEMSELRVTATIMAIARTGAEMEALTAVLVTLVTIYDMAKALDKTMQINNVELLEKSGGRSGHWKHP